MERIIKGRAVFVLDSRWHSWILRPKMTLSNNCENKIHSCAYWNVQLLRTKVQVHSSSEPPPEYYQDQTPFRNQGDWPLNKGGIDLCYERFYQFPKVKEKKVAKVPKTKFLGSDIIFCFIRISKFGNCENPVATFFNLSKLCLRQGRFILLLQMNDMISINYGSSIYKLVF